MRFSIEKVPHSNILGFDWDWQNGPPSAKAQLIVEVKDAGMDEQTVAIYLRRLADSLDYLRSQAKKGE